MTKKITFNIKPELRMILKNHLEWCKKEGRDTTWYEEKEQICKRSTNFSIPTSSDKR